MAVSLNGTPIPVSIYTRGVYQFKRAEVRQSGSGVGYQAGMQSVTWTWRIMELADWAWLVALVSTNPSLTLTSATLWLEDGTEQAFTAGELLRPTCEGMEGAVLINVKLEITGLEPIL